MAVNPQSLAKQKESLYQQIREASKQQAYQQYQTGLSALRNQLAQQRINMNQSRGQISEQAFMQQRNIVNQAQAKGLGSSGLRNLAGFQVQQQAGQAVNQLSQQNTQVQNEAMNVRRSLMNELSSATRAADLTYAQQYTDAQDKLYQMEQQEKQFQTQIGLELLTMVQSGATEEDLKGYAAFLGLDLDTLPDEQKKYLEDIGKNSEIAHAAQGLEDAGMHKLEQTILQIGGWIMVAGSIIAAPFTGGLSLATMPLGISAIVSGNTDTAWNDWMTPEDDKKPNTFTIGEHQIVTTSKEDAEQKLTKFYSDRFGEVKSGKIIVVVENNGDIKFKTAAAYGGQTYETLAQAINAVRPTK